MKALARIILAAAALCASASAAAAQDPQFGDFTFNYSYESALRPRHEWEGSNVQRLKGSLRIVLTPKIYFRLGNTSFTSRQNADGTRSAGVGATSLAFGGDILTEDVTGVRRNPSLSAEYSIILPTASKALGAFRPTNHVVGAAVGKSFGESAIVGGKVRRRNKFEVNAGGFFAEKPTGEYAKTPELTLAYVRTLDSLTVRKYSYRFELYASAPTKFGASEIYALNRLTIVLKNNVKFIAGVRAGLTPNSPRALFSGAFSFDSSFR